MSTLQEPLLVHGWRLYAHPAFLSQFSALTDEVEALKRKFGDGYREKNATKRLAAITRLVFDIIPQDPARPDYRQGQTLGPHRKHWFRAKFFQQYRLFFRFHAEARIIIYGWVNDTHSKRAYGSRTDAYAVFSDMLTDGHPPDDWASLLAAAKALEERS